MLVVQQSKQQYVVDCKIPTLEVNFSAAFAQSLVHALKFIERDAKLYVSFASYVSFMH